MIERCEISNVLVEAGVTQGALAMWWGSPHPELNYFSPRHALDLFPDEVSDLVLELARRDAAELQRMEAEPASRASASEHIDPSTRTGEQSICRGAS